jgi:dihydrodipicolinate synthase/N-acetylneuraminate lyase
MGVDVAAEKLIESQIAAESTGCCCRHHGRIANTVTRGTPKLIRLAIAPRKSSLVRRHGSNATQHAVADTKMAEKLGADGALPSRRITTNRARKVCSVTKTIADATSLPIMFTTFWADAGGHRARYRTRLAKECRNIVSIKQSGGRAYQRVARAFA